MTLNTIVQHQWEKQGVKFRVRPFMWVKALRTVDCALCGRHEKEKEIDESFPHWAILAHASDAGGKAPEICPKCRAKLSTKLAVNSPRTIFCVKCKEHQREKIYGIGWPGWSPLPSIDAIGQRRSTPQLCPNCSLELAKRLGKEFVRSTWTDLTYALGSFLTSTKIGQNQDNFEAMAQQHSGAPKLNFSTIKNICFIHADRFQEGGTGTYTVDYLGLTVNHSGPYHKYVNLWHQSFGGKGLSFDERLAFTVKTQMEANGHNFWWSVGEYSLPDKKFFGFYLDGLIMKGYNGDGVNLKQTSLWTYEAGTYTEVLKAILYPAEKIEFYRNGTLVGTSTEYLPSGVFPFSAHMLSVEAYHYGETCSVIVYNWLVEKDEYTES